MPITITIEGASADEVRQLVQDLAETITGMRPEDVPVDTKVSTLEQRPAGQAAPAAPQTGAATPAQAPVAPSSSAAPATPTNGAQPNGQPGGQARPPASAPTAPTAPPVAAPAAPQAPQPPVAPAAPTSAPQYDFNQIATATMQLQQAGQNIFEIFQQFGVQALNQLPKERYAEYAAALRQRGAKI